ncbi:MAG: translation initiation factor eIF-2B [Candidatus Aenigmatarchaeota archaeon]
MPELKEMVEKIKSLKIQGAKEIATESLRFLRKYSRKHGFGSKFNRAMKELEAARPTAVVLHNCIEILKKDKSKKKINFLLTKLKTSPKKIAEASRFIKSGQTIMTHCHSGTAVSVLRHAKKQGKRIKVIATETEPKQQGIRTAKELAAAGIPVTLIVDSAVSFFMPEVDLVMVGSDAMRKEGNVNKIGSLNIALAANFYKKPYYVVASTLKLDKRKKIEIEERPPSEVYKALKGVKIRNPAFDITPWRFITRIITEKGIMTPGNLKRLL